MSIETLFKLTQQQAKIDDFLANLKKHPKQVTEYKNLVLNGNLDPKETATMLTDIPHLKEKGFLIDDIMPTLDEFTAAAKESKPDHMVVPLSILKNASSEQLKVLFSVKNTYFDDVGCGMEGHVNHYTDEYGLKKTWDGHDKPSGARVTKLDLSKPENIQLFNDTYKSYENAMAKYELKKNTIFKERGKSLAEFHPLPQEIVDKHEKAVDEKSQAEYKAWQKVQERNDRPRVVDNTNWTKTPHRKYVK